MELFFKITMAIIMGYFIYRLWPVARDWLKHGPKGSSKDWQSFIFIMLALVGFVVFLIYMVRNI